MEKTELTQENKKRILAMFEDVPLFRMLKPEYRAKVLAAGQAYTYDPGDAIVSQGDPSDAFYLISEGQAMVYSEKNKERTYLTEMGPAGTFGEIGLLLNTPRTATITARNKVIAVRFSREVFFGLFEKVPAFGRAVAGGMARRLHKLSSNISLPDPEDVEVDEGVAARYLPVPFMMRHRILPLQMSNNVLTVGFVDDPEARVVNAVHNYVPGVKLRTVQIGKDYFDRVMSSRLDSGKAGAVEEAPMELEAAPEGGCRLDPLLVRGVAEGVSDFHMTVGKKPTWRLDGEIFDIPGASPPAEEDFYEIFEDFMEDRHKKEFEVYGDTDFSYTLGKHARFRVNLYRDIHGTNISMRLIPSQIMTVQQLGLPAIAENFCAMPSGLVVVTGPTGSGKSTTLAAMIHQVNQTRRSHIITLEDPVEFLHTNALSTIHQREIGGHTPDFARAIRSGLREDPDVILVGETRDLETLQMVIEVANTGHLVFATLHTNSAVSTVNRIVDMFPSNSQNQVRNTMSGVLKGIICQTLCKRIGGGRVAAFEVLVMTRAIGNLIREGKTQQILNSLQAGKKDGHQLLNEALAALVKDQVIEADEARAKAYDLTSLEVLLPPAGRI